MSDELWWKLIATASFASFLLVLMEMQRLRRSLADCRRTHIRNIQDVIDGQTIIQTERMRMVRKSFEAWKRKRGIK